MAPKNRFCNLLIVKAVTQSQKIKVLIYKAVTQNGGLLAFFKTFICVRLRACAHVRAYIRI